jgi:hypothetical protein
MRPTDDEIATVLRPLAELADDIDTEAYNWRDDAHITKYITAGLVRNIRSLLQRLEAVAPPASGDDSGRVEASGAELIDALLDASNDYEREENVGAQRVLKAQYFKAKQALLDHIVHMHDVGFLSGRRSMQEEAAKVADAWDEATSASDRPGDDIRALNPETKP